jgi:exonuclease SbcD
MRILHTSDWHLGRHFHGVQLLDAQVKVLQAIVDRVREDSVDVVVVAGDIYDRAVPSADAVAALDHLLAEIRGAGASIVGISGNHDSAVRVGFGERLMTNAGVSIRGNISAAGTPVLVPDPASDEVVAFYPIPYLDPETARHALESPDARTHDRLLKIALDRARADATQRGARTSIAIAHAFVTGGQGCDSELALSIGGSAEVALSHFSAFDYVALGHLHGRQVLTDGTVRYSGSPMAYSFSERGHTKGAWLVETTPGAPPVVTAVDLPVHRPLAQVRGDLSELLASAEHAPAEAAFVHAVLTDAVLPLDAMGKVRRRFPHAVTLSHEPAVQASVAHSYAELVHGRTDLDLGADFIAHVTGRPATPEEHAILSDVMTTAGAISEDRAA